MNLPNIEAEPTQMRQMLLNLIGNALKFHRPDEPPVVQVDAEIFSDVHSPFPDGRDSFCRMTVRDNGIGFDEIYLERIFEVFQRLHSRDYYEGNGIGLAICRKIVEHHGGSITAKSTSGQGAAFIVTLPIRQQAKATHHDSTQQASHDLDGR